MDVGTRIPRPEELLHGSWVGGDNELTVLAKQVAAWPGRATDGCRIEVSFVRNAMTVFGFECSREQVASLALLLERLAR